jgi:hypothetical protein
MAAVPESMMLPATVPLPAPDSVTMRVLAVIWLLMMVLLAVPSVSRPASDWMMAIEPPVVRPIVPVRLLLPLMFSMETEPLLRCERLM